MVLGDLFTVCDDQRQKNEPVNLLTIHIRINCINSIGDIISINWSND